MLKYCSYNDHYVDDINFGKSKNELDGLARHCKDCRRKQYEETKEKKLEYQKNYYKENKESILEYSKEWREENKEYKKRIDAEYRSNNKDKRKEYDKRRRVLNPGEANARIKEYKLRKVQATPKWLTAEMRNEIKQIYTSAYWFSFYFNEKYSVDHIQPIHGKDENGNHTLSGLHVPWNLRIMPITENSSKNSKLFM